MKEFLIKDIAELIAAVRETGTYFKRDVGVPRIWYRGTSSASHKLQPGVFRLPYAPSSVALEAQLFIEFHDGAPLLHDRCPDSDDASAWLVLMQHYGLPTRLLDWTESPLIAAYFAVCHDAERESSSSIWCLSPSHLNEHFKLDCDGIPALYHKSLIPLLQPAVKANVESPPIIVGAFAPHSDRRIAAQRGTFTVHGVCTPLEEMPEVSPYLVKLTIPAEARITLAEELQACRIDRRMLFPDLENLAIHIRRSWERWLRKHS